MKSIVLHVSYKGKEEGAARRFIEQIVKEGLQEAVKAEEGCLQYDYFIPMDGSDSMMLLEQWRDSDCIAKHGMTPAMGRIKELKAEYGIETELKKFAAETM